jgi:hypothetical protein
VLIVPEWPEVEFLDGGRRGRVSSALLDRVAAVLDPFIDRLLRYLAARLPEVDDPPVRFSGSGYTSFTRLHRPARYG